MTKANVGSYIRTLRIGCGMTQKTLADKLHVTDKAVSKWERDLSYPDIRLLPNLAEALNVTVSDLIRAFDDDGPPEELVEHYELSNDRRTPLHIILGCADLLESYHDDPAKFEHYLEAIRVSGKYLLSVLNVRNHTKERINPEIDTFLQDIHSSCENDSLAYDFTGTRILVVDDIEINREIAKEMLRPTGASVEFAANGRICIEMLERKPSGYYNLILMDILMPEMNGLEATRRIRSLKDPEKSIIPIIAVSANVSESDKRMSMDAGMNAFTEKPVNSEELYRTMHQFL